MRAIITFQGFTESEDKRTGTEDLYFSVIRNFSSPIVTTYQPRMWTSDVKALVGQLSRQGIESVAVVSYSHGQAAACAFAREAYEHGITVAVWCACDPVYRPTWLPRSNWFQPLAFRAMLGQGTIKVPANVRRVAWVRQTISRPCGHDLIAESPETVIEKAHVLNFTHTAIDNAPRWRELVRAELMKFVTSP
jgi:hypothetical protein